MSIECANERIPPEQLRVARTQLINELILPRLKFIEPTPPIDAYAILFSEMLHENIQRRVRAAYALDVPRRIEKGYIYVFRDVRNAPFVIKIGSTIHVRRRISEWRAALGATADELSELFIAKSADVRLAEAVIHICLHCQWLPKMERVDTGAQLLEYFRVPQLDALRLFNEAVCRHVTWRTERTTNHAAGHFADMHFSPAGGSRPV